MLLQESVRAVCEAAGWRVPPADEEGRYAFSLENGLNFTLSSPDGSRLLAYAVLLAPAKGREIGAELVASVLSATTGRFSRLRAVPTLEPLTGALAIYAFTDLRGVDAERAESFVEGFLNDLAFWKAQPWLTTA
ncbi:MAG: CesT family type III secretion system chaperone [Deltaproteobacteria bacterium]|jgi:hypothetical protein|nr:CesT family type III secretion system chaperone [Deltaproteobacteria bacterium]